MPQCRSCNAKIEWARNVDSQKMIPLDPDPHPYGNVIILATRDATDGARLCKVLKKGEERTGTVFVSHFVTCPNADRHRRR